MSQDIHQMSENLLWILNLLFLHLRRRMRSTVAKGSVTLHLLLHLSCAVQTVLRLKRADVDAELSYEVPHTQTADVNLNNL